MEITLFELFVYLIAWTIFYFAFASYVASLSRDRWIEWAKSKESDDELIEILEGVIDEIDDRVHTKLEQFQSSFFGSIGAASKKIDDATGQTTIKAITRENPIMGFVADMLMKRQGVDGLLNAVKGVEVGSDKPKTDRKLGL